MGHIRFHDLVFDDHLLGARRDDGAELRFTRQERALLHHFLARPGRLFTRAELLDSLGSDGADRVVDFVINRLRAKLGDRARDPRFIATQYGEGYVWIATAQKTAESQVFLVIGPLIGSGDDVAAAIGRLAELIQDRSAPHARVVVAPGWRRGEDGGAPRFSLEVRLRGVPGASEAVLFIREEPAHRVLRTFRRAPADIADPALATDIMDSIWEALSMGAPGAPGPEDLPLHLRMYEAAVTLNNGRDRWGVHAEPLSRAVTRAPDDARFAVMSALRAAVGLVLAPPEEPLSWAILRPIQDEIEGLVTAHQASLHRDPGLAIGAAKALIVAQRRSDLAERLVQHALESSAPFAAALPVLAQIHAARGELDQAIALYDEGRSLVARQTDADLYLINLKAATLLAADDRAGVEALYKELVAHRPPARPETRLLYAPPSYWPGGPDLDAMFDELDFAAGQRLASYQYFCVARYFESPLHQARVMAGVVDNLTRRHGLRVVPAEVRESLEQVAVETADGKAETAISS